MSIEIIEFGDQVRHLDRPEWGVGSVSKVESTSVEGEPAQRITARFANAGIKVLNSSGARLERLEANIASQETGTCRDQFDEIDRMSKDDLLAPIASRKLAELMLAIPEPCRDPFRSLEDRIRSTVELYRFDNGGKGLIGWAVMQTGLDDPLARFNRHELEEHFKRWSHEREQFLRKLMNEARDSSIDLDAILDATPNGAAAHLRRFAR